MSRIRSVHPGLWTDDAFMALSAHARLLVIGLWTEAFDDGVFEWKPLTIKARIFPVDALDMAALFEELLAGAFIRREEFGGRPIGLIRNFREFQRPKKPNSSGMLSSEWGTYVGISGDGGEPVPNQFGTSGEKSPQMEDGGWRMEEEDRTAPAVLVASGARDLFSELMDAFPQNPSSSESKAKAAFDRLKGVDQVQVIAAAERYSKWFAQDCQDRDRTIEAGLRFVPHLSKWLDSGDWREASKLAIKGEADPALAVVHRDSDDFAALKRLRGKDIQVYSDKGTITVSKAELEQARAGPMH